MEPLPFFMILGLVAFGSFFAGRTMHGGHHFFPHLNRNRKPQKRNSLAGFLVVMSAFMFLFLMSMNRYGQVSPLVLLCFLSYWLLLPVWVYQDAKERGERAWAWGLMTLFTNAMGFVSYLITRNEVRNVCQRCGYKLKEDFVVCPYCGPEAGRACSNCHAMLELDWIYCPYCRASVNLFDNASGYRVEPAPNRESNPPGDADDGSNGKDRTTRISATINP